MVEKLSPDRKPESRSAQKAEAPPAQMAEEHNLDTEAFLPAQKIETYGVQEVRLVCLIPGTPVSQEDCKIIYPLEHSSLNAAVRSGHEF